jgi:chemotaxis protein CheD
MNVVRGISSNKVVVRVADMRTSNLAEQEIVTYSLGSCLGITVYDPLIKVGGMLHVLLPNSSIDPEKANRLPFLFVNTGVPLLFRAMFELGAAKSRLRVKVAGGADMQTAPNSFSVGERNLKALLELFHHNGMFIHGKAVGGHISRTLRLNIATGNACVETPGTQTVTL